MAKLSRSLAPRTTLFFTVYFTLLNIKALFIQVLLFSEEILAYLRSEYETVIAIPLLYSNYILTMHNKLL